MLRKPVKRSCNPSQISTLERSEFLGYQGRIVSRLVLSSDGKLRAWMARLAGSDLPKRKGSQPTFALMAQTTCLASLSACTRYWPATQLRDRPSLFTGSSSSFSLHRGRRPRGRGPFGCWGWRNLRLFIGSSSSNSQTTRPDKQEPGAQGHRATDPATSRPQQIHPSIMPAQSGFLGQFAAIALHSPSLQKRHLARTTRQTKQAFTPTTPFSCRPNLQRCRSVQSSKHKSTAESTANRQHPSF